MAKEYAQKFYNSKAWQHTRNAYKKSVGGLCERCLKEGRYVGGELVHHKIHITPELIDNPSITLDWNNLELLCKECHALEHESEIRNDAWLNSIKSRRKEQNKRYYVDENGNVVIKSSLGLPL